MVAFSTPEWLDEYVRRLNESKELAESGKGSFERAFELAIQRVKAKFLVEEEAGPPPEPAPEPMEPWVDLRQLRKIVLAPEPSPTPLVAHKSPLLDKERPSGIVEAYKELQAPAEEAISRGAVKLTVALSRETDRRLRRHIDAGRHGAISMVVERALREYLGHAELAEKNENDESKLRLARRGEAPKARRKQRKRMMHEQSVELRKVRKIPKYGGR